MTPWWHRTEGFRLDAALVVAAVALLAVVVADRGQVSTDEAERRHHAVLEAWRVDDVARLVFSDPDGDGPDVTLTAARGDDGIRRWQLT
ncbi:MAG: hypothetical protein AAF928_17850, partial [Myxococcota bacterium]